MKMTCGKLTGLVASCAVLVLLTSSAIADTVEVTATGQVVSNRIQDAPLSGVGFGESVKMSFTVDSNNFVDGVPGDTRGYVIDHASFEMAFQPSGVTVGLEDPFPAGETPFFTLVDGFPVSDGFFVSTSAVSPGGVPLTQSPVNANLELGYTGDTLDSLDILDALGTYEFGGLTRFGFTLWQVFPDNAVMEMDFSRLTIVPEPSGLVLCVIGIAMLFRRRK